MQCSPTLFLAPVLWLALLVAPSKAQGGYQVQEFASQGVRIPVPRDYDTVPATPEDDWLMVRWVLRREKLPEIGKQKSTDRFLPEAMLIWIERQAPATGEEPPSGGDSEPPEDPPGDAGSERKPAQAPSGPSGQPPSDEQDDTLGSLEELLQQRMGGRWAIASSTPGKLRRDGHRPIALTFEAQSGAPSTHSPWATLLDGPGHQLILLGFCADADRKEQVKIWENMARKVEFFAANSKESDKWRKFYETRPKLIDPEYRIGVRARLVKGWEADDTENYIYVYSTKNEPLMRRIKIELEAIRTEYLKLFPPAAPITAVSTVRVCKDELEYKRYGGPEGTGGYWNWRDQELVLYDYPDDEGKKKGSGKADTRVVLYHEGFHQYIYYSAGAVSPHSWYNEGTGDFFSGAQVTANGVQRIGVNTWRLETIQAAIREKRYVPWKEIVRFEQAEYYLPSRVYLCYAQGWSMIYFLRTCNAVEKNPRWSRILPTYFEVLKREFNARMAELPEDAGMEVRFMVEKGSRDAAVEAAFEGIDYEPLTKAWEEYILGLELR
jgi:hypothetical protein